MFCKNCGRQLSDDESFCPGCGTKRAADTFGDGRSSSDMKNLPNYAKESDLHQSGHAIDSDRKKFSLSDDSSQKKFSLSGQSKFSLSDSGRNKFSLSDSSRKDAGDGIVRISANREPPAPPKAPTGFVNPLKDSGKTVFKSDNEEKTAAAPAQKAVSAGPAPTPKQEQPAQAGQSAQAAAQKAAPREPDAVLDGDGERTGFVNPLKNSDQNIHWGSDGDRNETKNGKEFSGDPGEINSHMGFAIFSTLCCCLPTGIVAIVFAAQVSKHIKDGNYEQAQKSADTAQMLCWISVILYFVLSVGSSVMGGISNIFLKP